MRGLWIVLLLVGCGSKTGEGIKADAKEIGETVETHAAQIAEKTGEVLSKTGAELKAFGQEVDARATKAVQALSEPSTPKRKPCTCPRTRPTFSGKTPRCVCVDRPPVTTTPASTVDKPEQ